MKQFYLYIILTLSLLSSYNIYGQNQEIDSLKTLIENVKQDIIRIDLLNHLSNKYIEEYQFDSAQVFATKAKELATQIDFEIGLGKAYKNLGLAHDYQGEFEIARENYNKALEIFTKIKSNGDRASTLINIAATYFYENNFLEAASIFHKALKISEEIDDRRNMASCHNNLGIIYDVQGDFSKALNEYSISLKLYEQLEDKPGMSAAHNNIGSIYSFKDEYDKALEEFKAAFEIDTERGDKRAIAISHANLAVVYGKQEKFLESHEENTLALNIYQEIGDKRGVAKSINNIGATYKVQNEFSKALEYFTLALELREEIDDQRGMASTYFNIGEIYITLKKVDEGRTYIQKSLDISLELGLKPKIQDAYYTLYIADSIQGNYLTALTNFKMYSQYKDSLFDEENTKKLTRANMQFEFDKRMFTDSLKQVELQNIMQAKLTKQKTYTWSGLGIAFLLIVFFAFIFKNNKKLTFERKKSDDLLLNILPEEVSEELKEKGATTASNYDNVTVLFTDFVGFTKVSEQMDSQELVDELHTCFKAFDEIISKYNIEKIKTIGDAYMAVSGLPQPVENHAQNTVKAALEIRDFMKNRRKEKGERTFDIRLGVHSGSVIAGVVGMKKFAYDIWGDTVNIAASMEQNSEVNKVNVSATTYELIKDEFQFEYRGKIDAETKGSLEMYFVEFKEGRNESL